MPIPVFFTPKMVANSGSISPSAAKPSKVVESWRQKFPITIIEPTPVTVDDFARAHDRGFVEDILACKRPNGFGNISKEVADSLPYTSGAMLSAARHVLRHGGVAVAPVSGFHHAGWATSEGFCTFNGLMVAACALKKAVSQRIGILDLDMHYGNGTDEILLEVNQEGWCRHFTAGATFLRAAQAGAFFDKWLPHALDKLSDCGLVLYQAGADPHVSDPYGGWLTTEELRRRDAIVFDAFAEKKIPIVWNLAGGYQTEPDGSIPKVLEIHDNTMRECVRAFSDG